MAEGLVVGGTEEVPGCDTGAEGLETLGEGDTVGAVEVVEGIGGLPIGANIEANIGL